MSAMENEKIDLPRVDKAALLNGLHSYLGSRIDSIGRRASFMMALLGSFLGIAAMAVLLLGETAKIKA